MTDKVETARVLGGTAKTEGRDVIHVPCRPWCRFCVLGGGQERRHLTQSGDRDVDRPRVFADCGCFSRNSTPSVVAKDRRTEMTFAAAFSLKGGGDPHAARCFAKRVDGPASVGLFRRVRELLVEWTTTVVQITPLGYSAGNETVE